MEADNTDKEDYTRFFSWIVWGFLAGLIAGIWAYIVLELKDNVYFSSSIMAAIMVAMITITVSVIAVVFSSKLFKHWLKDRFEISRAVKAKLRQERLRKSGAMPQQPIFVERPHQQAQANNQSNLQSQPQQIQQPQEKDMTMQDGWDETTVK